MHAARTTRFFLLAAYFLLCNYLFFLPGSALPKEDWLDKIFFDKWVHIGLFALLTWLCRWCGLFSRPGMLATILSSYGLAVEFAQGAWVPNRSFDVWDWVADAVGILLGILTWTRLAPRLSRSR